MDHELLRALQLMEIRSGSLETVKMRSLNLDESVAVEFGTVDNLGENQFRYKCDSLS